MHLHGKAVMLTLLLKTLGSPFLQVGDPFRGFLSQFKLFLFHLSMGLSVVVFFVNLFIVMLNMQI